jgi:hypothetical protein
MSSLRCFRPFVVFAICGFLTTSLLAQEKADPAKEVDTKKLRDSLLGAWELVGVPGIDAQPKPGARMKFWGLKHWTITESNPETGELVFHHGGTYTLDGDNYEETITFAAENTRNMIGTKLKFKIKVDGDTYVQTGIGNSFTEQWQRLKSE